MRMLDDRLEIVNRSHLITGHTTQTLVTKAGQRWFGTLDVRDRDDTNALAEEMVRRWNAAALDVEADDAT